MPTALVLQLAITAMQHATELNRLLVTATNEGRDVTVAELADARTRAGAAVNALQDAIDERVAADLAKG